MKFVVFLSRGKKQQQTAGAAMAVGPRPAPAAALAFLVLDRTLVYILGTLAFVLHTGSSILEMEIESTNAFL